MSNKSRKGIYTFKACRTEHIYTSLLMEKRKYKKGPMVVGYFILQYYYIQLNRISNINLIYDLYSFK